VLLIPFWSNESLLVYMSEHWEALQVNDCLKFIWKKLEKKKDLFLIFVLLSFSFFDRLNGRACVCLWTNDIPNWPPRAWIGLYWWRIYSHNTYCKRKILQLSNQCYICLRYSMIGNASSDAISLMPLRIS
jgi:hypothetical protein